MMYFIIGVLIAVIVTKYWYCLYQGLKTFTDRKFNGHA